MRIVPSNSIDELILHGSGDGLFQKALGSLSPQDVACMIEPNGFQSPESFMRSVTKAIILRMSTKSGKKVLLQFICNFYPGGQITGKVFLRPCRSSVVATICTTFQGFYHSSIQR